MDTLVSICMPNYNYERFIGEAIESVLAQTYENFELIICDNASNDSSKEIIRSYKDPRIKFFQNEENIPLYQNVKKCINLSKGELIAVLHSDDKYDPNFLQEIVKNYKKYPDHKVFVTGVYIYHNNKNTLIPWYPYNTSGIKSQREVLMRLMLLNNIGNGVNVVLHRDAVEKVPMFSNEYKYASDYDYWMRLAEKFEFVSISKILTYYRIHDSNLSHVVNKDLSMFKEGINIVHKNLLKSRIIPKKNHEEFKYYNLFRILQRSLDNGVKYESGEICRTMLKYSWLNFPRLRYESNFYLIYILSFLMNRKFSVIAYALGRCVLYAQNKIINFRVNKLSSRQPSFCNITENLNQREI